MPLHTTLLKATSHSYCKDATSDRELKAPTGDQRHVPALTKRQRQEKPNNHSQAGSAEKGRVFRACDSPAGTQQLSD